jgi:hypothetical protein
MQQFLPARNEDKNKKKMQFGLCFVIHLSSPQSDTIHPRIYMKELFCIIHFPLPPSWVPDFFLLQITSFTSPKNLFHSFLSFRMHTLTKKKELFMQFSRVMQSLAKRHNFSICFSMHSKRKFPCQA